MALAVLLLVTRRGKDAKLRSGIVLQLDIKNRKKGRKKERKMKNCEQEMVSESVFF